MSNPTNPRQSLLGLVNAYPKTDIQLWKILKILAETMTDLKSDTDTIKESIVWTLRIKIDSLETGTNLAAYWPRVYIPRDPNGNLLFNSVRLKTVGISAEGIPSTDLILDLQVSSDGSVKFASVFNSATALTLPKGAQTITYGTNTIGTLKDAYIFRVNCSQTGGATSAEIYLSGYYQ